MWKQLFLDTIYKPQLAASQILGLRLPAGTIWEALALASDKVQRSLDGAEVRKIIVVPDRLVNIVT